MTILDIQICQYSKSNPTNYSYNIFSNVETWIGTWIPYLRRRWTPSELRSLHPQPGRGSCRSGAVRGRGSGCGGCNRILEDVLLRFDDRRRFHHDRGTCRPPGELRIRVLPVYPVISTAARLLLRCGQERVGMLLHQVGWLGHGQQVSRGGHRQQAGLVHQNRLRGQRGDSRFVHAFRRLGQAQRRGGHVDGGGNDVRRGSLARVRRQMVRFLLDTWLAQQTIPLRTYLLRVNDWKRGRRDVIKNCYWNLLTCDDQRVKYGFVYIYIYLKYCFYQNITRFII